MNPGKLSRGADCRSLETFAEEPGAFFIDFCFAELLETGRASSLAGAPL